MTTGRQSNFKETQNDNKETENNYKETQNNYKEAENDYKETQSNYQVTQNDHRETQNYPEMQNDKTRRGLTAIKSHYIREKAEISTISPKLGNSHPNYLELEKHSESADLRLS